MVLRGIFCDCFGTLVGPRGWENKPLVRYLNAQYTAGTPVTVFSSEPADIEKRIQALGLHADLTKIHDKKEYDGAKLETLIDDHPPKYLRAQKHWHPDDPLFRIHMRQPSSHRFDTR